MLECAEHTEWGHVFQKGEVEQLLENLASILLACSIDPRPVQDIYSDERSPSLTLDSRIPLTTILPNTAEPFELPSFFRWVVPFHLAVMSTPRNEINFCITPDLATREMKGSAQPYHDRSCYPPPY